MKKQLLLFVMLLLPLVASADAIDIGGIYYNLNAENKTAEVASNPNKYSGCVIIPSSVKYEGTDYTVTSIGTNAFFRCSDLSCVVIGNNVTAISGNNTFARGKLKDLWSFMETPPVIAKNTFQLNNKATLHVPASSIEAYRNAEYWNTSFLDIVAIDDNPINDNPITFADANVKALCVANWDNNGDGELSEREAFMVANLNGVFSQNETITSFDELPYFVNVSSIGENEFKDCSHLTSISIPSGVSTIGSEAFSGCSSLKNVWAYRQTPPDIEYTTFTNRINATLHVPIHSIAAYRSAYYWNEFLTILAISDKPLSSNPIVFADANVKALCVANWDTNGDGELSEMEASKVMDLQGVFSQNEAITSFDELSYFIGLQRIEDNEFKGCTNLTSISIPYCVASIGNTYLSEAFSGCDHLLKVELHCDAIVSCDFGEWGGGFPDIFGRQVEEYILGDEITGIGMSAFRGAYYMKSIKISDNVTKIGRRAFEWCYGYLRSLTLPNSLREIDDYAFNGCDLLTSINIPANVEKIGEWAFDHCSSLRRVYCYAKPIQYTDVYSFPFMSGYYQKATLHVPADMIEAYRKAKGWNGFGNIVALESVVDGLYYTFDDNAKTAEIVSTTGDLGVAFALPSTVNHDETTYNVTGIGARAFTSCYDLTSVTIPNSISSIGEGAFDNCTGLTSVVLGEGVTSIGAGAFYACTSLPSVVIPSSVTSIGTSVFSACHALTSIKVENGNAIYDSRNNCNAIIETATNTLVAGCPNTVIPEDVTKIGDYAFYYCTGLTSIIIPNGVTAIGSYAFSSCWGLTSIAIPSGATSIDNHAFSYCSSLTSIDIPNSVTSIGSYAFYYCGNLTSIIIPNGVTSIENNTFDNCSGLTSITIPNSVTSIGESAFNGCALTSVTIPNSVTSIGDGAFINCRSLTSIDIPSGVTSIGNYTFSYCGGLTSIAIPSGVTSIGNGAFQNCTGLTSVTIPNSVTSIGDGAFWDCSALISVTIPNSVSSIGGYAFQNCSGLTSVVIPSSVTIIGMRAFDGCLNMTNVYCYAEQVPEKGNSYSATIWDGFNCQDATLHVPAGSIEDYRNNREWKDFGSIVALTEDDPKPTGIKNVRSQKSEVKGAFLDLNGRQLNGEPTQKGLYIHHGKKIIVK